MQKSIEFVCQYSLADQSVEADFNIAGKDMEFARAARGQLHYTLVPTTETVIGDDHHFDIIPATPGVIYSRYFSNFQRQQISGYSSERPISLKTVHFQHEPYFLTVYIQSHSMYRC